MLFSFAANTLVAHQCTDKAEMLSALDTCTKGSLVLGIDAEQQREFYMIKVNLGWSGLESFGIGICSEGHGLTPGVLLQHDQEKLLVGFNSTVVGIAFPEGKVLVRLPLESLFHVLTLSPSDPEYIVVQHEIGIVVLDTSWETKWQYSRDVISKLWITADEIALEFMDSPPVRLKLDTGQLLR